jgi:hypothetical protein
MPGSILNENENISHENFSLNSNAASAMQDAQMIRAPIAAATRFSQAYYGDASNSNLATATSLELPILKAVESRQEVVEALVRWCLELVIEKAVDSGRISEERDPEEISDEILTQERDLGVVQASLEEGCELVSVSYRARKIKKGATVRRTVVFKDAAGELQEAHEDRAVDEEDTRRDLGYEFGMPSPLRRMMGDLVTSIANVARTFDPNNTNLELTKALATIVFGEAFEVQDPSDLVERIWPPGYVDPMVAAAQAAQAPPMLGGAPGAGGGDPAANPYGAPMQSTLPENAPASGPYATQQAAQDIPEPLRAKTRGRGESLEELFDREVLDVAVRRLNDHLVLAEGGE